MITKPLPKAKMAEDMGAMAGLRHAEVMNAKIAHGASILYDPWQDALRIAKDGVRKFVALKDKVAYEHCFMATFRENFTLGAGNEPQN
jgi:hypothetical protein